MQHYNENKSITFINIWSKCIDIQMHFNSLNLTIKSLAITGFTFFIAGIGYLYKEKVYLEEVNVLMWFSLMGALIISLFYFIDRHWYHQYLRATSMHIASIEEQQVLDEDLKKALLVSKRISEESKKPLYGIMMSSVARTRLFYFTLFVPFIIISFYAFIKHDNNDKLDILIKKIESIEQNIKKTEVNNATSPCNSLQSTIKPTISKK